MHKCETMKLNGIFVMERKYKIFVYTSKKYSYFFLDYFICCLYNTGIIISLETKSLQDEPLYAKIRRQLC